MSDLDLRAYTPADRAAIMDVQMATLFMGEPLPFPVRDIGELLALFTDYFLECEPELAQVAVDGAGRVVGYMLCGVRPEHEDAWRRPRLARLARLWARRWHGYDAFTRLYYRLRLRDAWEVMRHPEPAVPAVCHWNMLPQARGHLARQMQWRTASACLERGITHYGGGLTAPESYLRLQWSRGGGELLAHAPHHTLTALRGEPIVRLTLRFDCAVMLATYARPPRSEVAPPR